MKSMIMALAAASIGVAGNASAATIVWSAPTTDTGNVSDVVTTGTTANARMSGKTTTVNGVIFAQSYGAIAGTYMTGPVTPTFTNTAYKTLVTGGYMSTSNSTMSFSLLNLTVGNSYLFQAFMPFSSTNWATTFTGGANTSDLVNATGSDDGAGASTVPQNIVGTFVADATSQTITLTSPTHRAVIGAFQLRNLGPTSVAAVPEPATWAMMFVGFGMIGAFARYRRSPARLSQA